MTEVSEQIATGLEKVNEGTLECLAALHERARELTDEFWVEHHRVRNTRPKEEWGYIGVRARLRDGSLQIEWFRAKFWQPRGKREGSGPTMPALEYLRRGRSPRYSPKVFERVRAKEWEIKLAMAYEDQFEHIRRESQMIGKIRRYVAEARKADERRVAEVPS